jgi:hypothetical protein
MRHSGRPQALFLNGLVGCGHMSGLVARRICPLALMKSDDQNPYQICELQAHVSQQTVFGLRWRPCRSSRFNALAKLQTVIYATAPWICLQEGRRPSAFANISARKISPVLIIAQMIRASLLASATVTRRAGFFARSALIQSASAPLCLLWHTCGASHNNCASRTTFRQTVRPAILWPARNREGPGPAAGRAWHNACLGTGQRGFLARALSCCWRSWGPRFFCEYLARYIAYEAQHSKLHRRRVLVMADDKGLEQVTQLLHPSGRSPYRFLTIASWISFADRTSRKFTLRSASAACLR